MREDRPPRTSPPSREDRLAAALRANLHRRKAQARALDADGSAPPAADEPAPPASVLPKDAASG